MYICIYTCVLYTDAAMDTSGHYSRSLRPNGRFGRILKGDRKLQEKETERGTERRNSGMNGQGISKIWVQHKENESARARAAITITKKGTNIISISNNNLSRVETNRGEKIKCQ